MVISYNLEEADIAAFVKYVDGSRAKTVASKARHLKKIWYVLLPFILVVGVILSENHIAGVVFVFLALFWLQELWRRWYLKMYYQIFARDALHQGSLGERKLTLEKDFLIEIRPFRELHFAWNGIHDVIVTNGHIFIRTSETQAFIVPKRAFKDMAESELFRERLENLWRTGQDVKSDPSLNVCAG